MRPQFLLLDEAEPLKHEQRDPSSQTDGMNPTLFTMLQQERPEALVLSEIPSLPAQPLLRRKEDGTGEVRGGRVGGR